MSSDLIAALRQLRRSPGHILVVALSLGIGIAVSVAAFSVTNTLVFSDLPGIADGPALIRIRWTLAMDPISEEDFDVIGQQVGGVFSNFAADGTRQLPVVLPFRAGHGNRSLRVVRLLQHAQ